MRSSARGGTNYDGCNAFVIWGGLVSFCFFSLVFICPLLLALFLNVRDTLRKAGTSASRQADFMAHVPTAQARIGFEAAAVAATFSAQAPPSTLHTISDAIMIELQDAPSDDAPVCSNGS